MRRFRNPILIGLVATGAVVSSVAVLDRVLIAPVDDSTKHCIINTKGDTFTSEEAEALLELYKKEVEFMGGFTAMNATGCEDFFDKLDTAVIARLKRDGGAGGTIEDLSPAEYQSLLEALMIKRSNRNNDVIRNSRQTKKDEPVRLSEF